MSATMAVNMSKLMGHSQDLARALPFIRQLRPKFWLAIDPDPTSAQECINLGVCLIVRHHSVYDFNEAATAAQIAQGVTPSTAALEFYHACQNEGWWPSAWGILTPSAMAMPSSPPEVLAWAVAFQADLVALFRGAGKATIVCGVPTGHDGYLVPGAEFYHCQEYGWPEVASQAPWHARRHLSWFPGILAVQPTARLFISEVGATYLLAP